MVKRSKRFGGDDDAVITRPAPAPRTTAQPSTSQDEKRDT